MSPHPFALPVTPACRLWALSMPTLDEAFHQAAVNLEEDLRQIDAGDVEASPFSRAVIAGAVAAWKHPESIQTGSAATDNGG